MDQYVNIKYYFYCRHKLKVSLSKIRVEIKDLFRVKIPMREGLVHWADCISNTKENAHLFDFDSNNTKCFKFLKFQLKPNELFETKMIQFYALCRHQLNVCIPDVLDELKLLYEKKAPSLITLHSWVIGCLKKELNSFESDDDDDKDVYVEIDLTKDDDDDDDIEEENDYNNETINLDDTKNNDLILKFYFYCRKRFNLKLTDIYKEMKLLFDNNLIPENLNSLYIWNKLNLDFDDIDISNTSDETFQSALKFQLNLNEESRLRRVQFYAMCRNELKVKEDQILSELNQLFGKEAFLFNRLKRWIRKTSETELHSNELDEKLKEKDALIEYLKQELNLTTKKFEQKLTSKQLELSQKETQIEELNAQLAVKQMHKKSTHTIKKMYRRDLNRLEKLVKRLQCKSSHLNLEKIEKLILEFKLKALGNPNQSTINPNNIVYQMKIKRLFYMQEMRKLKELNLKLKQELKENEIIKQSISVEKDDLKINLKNSNDLIKKLKNELILKNRQRTITSNDETFRKQIRLLEQEIKKLNKKLDESYEFLLDKEASLSKVYQDIQDFHDQLKFMLKNSNAEHITNDNAQLYDCLLKIKSHLENASHVKRFENNQCKIIRIIDGSQLRHAEFLNQIKSSL